jgi:hypothetical protein
MQDELGVLHNERRSPQQTQCHISSTEKDISSQPRDVDSKTRFDSSESCELYLVGIAIDILDKWTR